MPDRALKLAPKKINFFQFLSPNSVNFLNLKFNSNLDITSHVSVYILGLVVGIFPNFWKIPKLVKNYEIFKNLDIPEKI